MDNKLSELSKPVAWAFKDANDVEHASITKKANLYGRHDFQPLYSQEYLSALLADNEALKIRVGQQQSVADNNLDMFRKADARAESLLAELEQANKRAEVESVGADKSAADCVQWMKRTEAAEKRIAELEGDKRQLNEIINTEANRADAAEKQLVYSRDAMATWERKAISNFEECAKMSQRIEELKNRLATPVPFPDCDITAVSHMAHWLSDEEAKAWVKGVEFAKQQVRAAGFKCVGDEQ